MIIRDHIEKQWRMRVESHAVANRADVNVDLPGLDVDPLSPRGRIRDAWEEGTDIPVFGYDADEIRYHDDRDVLLIRRGNELVTILRRSGANQRTKQHIQEHIL